MSCFNGVVQLLKSQHLSLASQGRVAGSSAEHLETDGLGSLEKLHTIGTMGTMRSIRSNGSIPTLERVRREESNHSIGSHSQASSGQVIHPSSLLQPVCEAAPPQRVKVGEKK